jgi:LysR family nitrogen assimilation transcriptional regulator
MNLKQLSCFVAIAESGSLSAASSRIWLSQSALSRQLQGLERELGAELFERKARGMRLTQLGESFFQKCKGILKECDAIMSGAGALGNEPSGALSIGTPPSLRSMLVSKFAAQFVKRHDKVKLLMKEGTSRAMRDALGRGELDLAIVAASESLEGFYVDPLVTEALCFVGPPNGGLSMRRSISASSINKVPLLLTPLPNSLRTIVDRAMGKNQLRSEPVVEAETVSMLLDLVRLGLGYSVLPYSAIYDELKARSVSACLIRGLNVEWVIAYSRERVQTTAATLARRAIAEVVRAKLNAQQWPTAKLAGNGRLMTPK